MIYDTWESTSGSLAIMAITDPKNPIGMIDMGVKYPQTKWHGIIYSWSCG